MMVNVGGRRSCERVRSALLQGISSGRELGAQLYATIRGEPRCSLALGEASAGVPLETDTLMFWISNSKPVMGVALGQLRDRGLLRFDDLVVQHLPEFGFGNKQDLTLAHLLTHTCGFRFAWYAWEDTPPFWNVVETICRTPQEDGWIAGETAGYNVAAAWYVLAAVLERADGRSYGAYVRQEIFEPLEMNDCFIGMSAETFRAYGPRINVMPHFEDGVWKRSPAYGTEEGVGIQRPGGNGYGPTRELVRLYEMLLGAGVRDGVRLLDSATATEIVARHTQRLPDRTFGNVVFDRGLGVVLNSRATDSRFCWFGTHASGDAFGHQGYFSSVAFADPAHDLAVALVFNGVREASEHDERVIEAIDALYADLELVTEAQYTKDHRS